MGTEAPAAYPRGRNGSGAWRSLVARGLIRPLAVGGGAAGVAVLMGIPLVGTAYILELGRRHHAPLNAERVTAALVGGFVGWLLDISLGVDLIRLVIPKEPPHNLYQGDDHGAGHRSAFRGDTSILGCGDLSSERLAGPSRCAARARRAGPGGRGDYSLGHRGSVGRCGTGRRGDHVGRNHSCVGAYRACGRSASRGSHHRFGCGRRMRRPLRAIYGDRRSRRTGVRTVTWSTGRSCWCSRCSGRDQRKLSLAFHRDRIGSRPRRPQARDADLPGDGRRGRFLRHRRRMDAGSNFGSRARH